MKPHESKWLIPRLPSRNEVLRENIAVGHVSNEIATTGICFNATATIIKGAGITPSV
jgi:hypothetical protein